MKKIFTIALLRDLEKQVMKGDISYSKMVEILNEKAWEGYSDRIEGELIDADYQPIQIKPEFKMGFSVRPERGDGIDLLPTEKLKGYKNFEVWSEGYSVTGNDSTAMFHGIFKGETFKDAVSQFKESITDPYDKSCLDLETLRFWGCKFFDNENDARKSFG